MRTRLTLLGSTVLAGALIGTATANLRLVLPPTHVTPASYRVPSLRHHQPRHTRWRITLTPHNRLLLHKVAAHAAGPTGTAIANHLVNALHQQGFSHVRARVEPKRGRIALRILPTFARSGSLTQYLPGGRVVTQKRIKALLPLLSAAARARHDHVTLDLDRKTMTLTPRIASAPGHAWHIGTIFSSYGPRYAGSDVISGYGRAAIDGFDVSASVTRGLSGLTPKQSAGGGYLGEAVSIARPTPEGIFSVQVSHAHYLTGGHLHSLDLTGTVNQLRAGDRYPIFDGHVWLRGGVAWASDSDKLGVLGWRSTQRDLSVYAGASGHYAWHGVAMNVRGAVWQGLAGSDTGTAGAPNIMGRWGEHYTVERFHLSLARDAGPVRLTGKFGYQHGSPGTPQVYQAYIGGLGRGSSFFTGAFAGPSGYWWSGTVAKAKPIVLHPHFRLALDPFVGVNGGSVSPDAGPARHVASVDVGAGIGLTKHLTGEIGWSHTVAQPRGSHAGNRVTFETATRF